MRLYRFLVMLLLAIFLADTAAASASLHLPAAAQATAQAGAHQHHAMHEAVPHGDDQQPHADNCRSCHDCLSCFSALPVMSRVGMTPDVPQHTVADALSLIYFPPALAQLQRPPISLPA